MNDIVKVLIVEDDKALQEVYAMILSSQGFRVATANNGYEALDTVRKDSFDVILLDYFMPEMDGKTFMHNFDSEQYPKTKVVLASNVSDKSTIEEMLSLGVHSYILKSDLSPSQLIDCVETVHTEVS